VETFAISNGHHRFRPLALQHGDSPANIHGSPEST
jgi:hypothetical protein